MADWNQKPRCQGCGKEIDPDVCWCGMPPDAHNPWYDGHEPVPLGCECGFDDGGGWLGEREDLVRE